MPSEAVAHQWAELETALACLNSAEFEVNRGGIEAADMWLGDLRRSLGALALMLSETPDAVGQGKLLEHIIPAQIHHTPLPRLETRDES